MAFETIVLEVVDGVAKLTLNRPEAMNSLNAQLAAELRTAAIDIERNPEVRAVLISANGRIFSGGGDLKAFNEQGDNMAKYASNVTVDFHAAISRFTKIDPPIVAAVHGAAGGAGMSMVSSFDIVVAAESAKFTMAYTNAGLCPDGSSSYFLSRVVGLRRAMDLMLTNRVLTASEAEEWGLVSRVVPDENLYDEALALAQQLAAGPTRAYGAAKRVLYEGATSSLEQAMERESLAIAGTMETADGREGVAAFLDKRTPDFIGR